MSQMLARSFEYDCENRLVAVKSTGNPAEGHVRVSFGYDYRGRRVRKLVETFAGGAWTTTADRKFIRHGWRPVLELDGTDGDRIMRKYTWGLDLSGSLEGAGGIGGLLALQDTRGTGPQVNDYKYIYFYDANGNVGQLADIRATTWSTDVLTARYEYSPFGKLLSSEGTYADANPFRFSTKYFDVETGLSYYGYRYYNAQLGRWVNRDPIGESGGNNVYEFACSRPTDTIDPFGTKPPRRPAVCGPYGLFWVERVTDIDVDSPEHRKVLEEAGLNPDSLIGFQVAYDLSYERRKIKCGACNECRKRRNIRLVQVIYTPGETIGVDATKAKRRERSKNPGKTDAPGMGLKGSQPISFRDGPWTPRGGDPSKENIKHTLEVCAVCKACQDQYILGCVKFDWYQGKKGGNWTDRQLGAPDFSTNHGREDPPSRYSVRASSPSDFFWKGWDNWHDPAVDFP